MRTDGQTYRRTTMKLQYVSPQKAEGGDIEITCVSVNTKK